MLRRWIFDVESMTDYFCCTFLNYDTDERITFEISRRKNELSALRNFWKTQIRNGISFNGHGYDNILLNWLVSTGWDNRDGGWVATEIGKVTQIIINQEKNRE